MVIGLAVAVVARSLVLGVVAGATVVLWPMIAGGGKVERAALSKLEALAQWTEALRDLAQKGAGLESVIPKTVETASDVLVAPLRLMSRRLSVKVPLPQALSLFADEVDDASADMVVAALALAARQRRGKLSDVLTALSHSLRDELEQRTKVMRERNVIRREAGQVAVLTGVLVLSAHLFAPPTLAQQRQRRRTGGAGDPGRGLRVGLRPGPQARRTRTRAAFPLQRQRGPRGRDLPSQGAAAMTAVIVLGVLLGLGTAAAVVAAVPTRARPGRRARPVAS